MLNAFLLFLFLIAFAELQTDMTDLTADLESSGIPTLDERSFVMKVFFPGVHDHPILGDPKVRPIKNFLTNDQASRVFFADEYEIECSLLLGDQSSVTAL